MFTFSKNFKEIQQIKKDIDRIFDLIAAIETYLNIRIEIVEYPREIRAVKKEK